MATVGLILVIASANVANLLLARSQRRQREIAIRQAIGATRRRIAQLLLAESLVLALAGGALGLLLAFWFVAVFEVRTSAAALPLTLPLEPNAIVLLFTAGLSICVALAAGLIPALAASRIDLAGVIRRGDDGARVAGGMTRSRQALAVVQIGLCLVLMIGSALFLRSLSRLRSVDPSLNTDRILAATVDLNLRGYDRVRGQQLYDDLLGRIRATPGIQSATLAFVLPVTAGGMRNNLGPRQTSPALDTAIEYDVVPVADKFFDTLGIPLLRGRDFADESATAPRVIIVNETFKQKFWPDRGRDRGAILDRQRGHLRDHWRGARHEVPKSSRAASHDDVPALVAAAYEHHPARCTDRASACARRGGAAGGDARSGPATSPVQRTHHGRARRPIDLSGSAPCVVDFRARDSRVTHRRGRHLRGDLVRRRRPDA